MNPRATPRRPTPSKGSTALNAVCPYFTMFPLAFPHRILGRYASANDAVLDPFAGRGTTLYAARLHGMPAYGIDANPVAAAISQAKLVNTTCERVMRAYDGILADYPRPRAIPAGSFWKKAFHEDTLRKLCRLREGLLENCDSDSRQALRAILLGALHGPRNKHEPSYFSNQSPRTFAPKPAYALKYWKRHKLTAPAIDIRRVVERRASRYFENEVTVGHGSAICGDSQEPSAYRLPQKVSWIITSPPYFGMRTYVPDQWLRWWFLGGPELVDYSCSDQLPHTSKDAFSEGLRKVWTNCAKVAKRDCRLVIRFGAINDRKVDSAGLVKESLVGSPWRLLTVQSAGTASAGKRQAETFVESTIAIEEHDVWAALEG